MFRYLKYVAKAVANLLSYLMEGCRHNLSVTYFKALEFYLRENVRNFYTDLHLNKSKHAEFNRLQRRVKGLHQLFGNDLRFSYSILIPIDNVKNFERCLLSCFEQTPKHFEILIGSKTPLPKSCQKTLHEIQKRTNQNIAFYDFSHEENVPLINCLAEKSSMNFLLIVDGGDWIRPDMLFRYEQLLRTFDHPEEVVISSNENVISGKGIILPNSEKKRALPVFPYLFQESPLPLRGLLIPTPLWRMAGGLRSTYLGAEVEDVLLRLDLAGAVFSHIPFAFYSRQRGVKDRLVPFDKAVLKRVLEEYAPKKGLNWKFAAGENEYSSYLKAIPEPAPGHKIHVIVPYKDLKTLTLRCIDLALKQKGVDLVITAIDNHSEDKSIAESIRQMGGEVLTIDEPFNYSRLNNLAVDQSRFKSCDLLLFLNNDVELESDALLEMVRWIDQPKVGTVGACLFYPDGKLQHGGVTSELYKFQDRIHHVLIEYLTPKERCHLSKAISIVDSVSGACMLIKKELFLEIGGFNEIWYPIAYSDVELGQRIADYGLKNLYTPYAIGIHHESVSRKVVLEDVENTRWLHDLTQAQAKARKPLRL